MSETRLMKQPRKDSPIENIIASYLDEREIDLTPNELKLKTRYEAAFTMLIEEDSLIDTVTKLEKLYNISKATAYRTIQASETIFGSVKKFNKDAWRFIQVERKRKLINKAITADNLELAAKLERDIDNLLQFDKDDALFDPRKLEALTINITLPRSTQSALRALISKGVVDLNNLEAEDISHEDVTTEE